MWHPYSVGVLRICGILTWIVSFAPVLWLPRSSGYGITRFRVTIARNVNVARGYCHYKDRLFNSTLYSNDLCARLVCLAKEKTVRMTWCEPPGPGCHWSHRNESFPDCCRTECPPPTSTCRYKDRLLQSGDFLSISNPCVTLKCNAGNLTVNPCRPE
ncbi:uncharacterized protein [Dermacentor albipictus]|uniref:uncharacterized protein n=1 Tax=Dermacentor albipictus TaxID=60249 RepID=UPI0031FCE2B1